MHCTGKGRTGHRSLSARRAWIEICFPPPAPQRKPVALRKESVDRNALGGASISRPPVALRKESVDRNNLVMSYVLRYMLVALRKESVDRNVYSITKSGV